MALERSILEFSALFLLHCPLCILRAHHTDRLGGEEPCLRFSSQVVSWLHQLADSSLDLDEPCLFSGHADLDQGPEPTDADRVLGYAGTGHALVCHGGQHGLQHQERHQDPVYAGSALSRNLVAAHGLRCGGRVGQGPPDRRRLPGPFQHPLPRFWQALAQLTVSGIHHRRRPRIVRGAAGASAEPRPIRGGCEHVPCEVA
mmetsp:Transcript_1805/g.7135  ORF Transcript_1805/g.7135 Transcript_1805/m.7135 type:complete len:201 (+) Transcript_1805:567-1169(+)